MAIQHSQINLEFVEREATPRLLMKLSVQLYLAGLLLSNTALFLEVFGVDRVRSTVHNWVHKADLQPKTGRYLNHLAVDETVIQLDDEQYWLYAAVDPSSNDLLHTKLEPTRNGALADQFSRNSEKKMLMTRRPSNELVANITLISNMNVIEIGTASNVFFAR